ncbi:uncharacterized protein PAC_13458 [Phialocephala subalpina]|uniref:2EXR domain-containing protein n=1 Tax=Phialocephala subalpina TaxID=576137 RepID=A0A1L7XEW0_9HELO|nr:uncharacterized protein PAC_13458 [Phialocephala subalpina]
MTQALAVDIKAVPRRNKRPTFDEEKYCRYAKYFGEGKAGVRYIILVVGNDDDICEVTLISFEYGHTYSTRERGNAGGGESLSKACGPLRKPLQLFTGFPKLPTEVQDMIWNLAMNVPRVLKLLGAYDGRQHPLANRQPSLFSSGKRKTYYRNWIDTLQLEAIEFWGEQVLPKAVSSLGLPFSWIQAEDFNSRDVKYLQGNDEIVVLQGERVANCEMELVPHNIPCEPESDKLEGEKTQSYVNELLKEMEKKLKKLKTHEEKSKKQGKSSPDWTPLQ